ncbi:MAG: SDR family oxidoreductase [Clostridia bacterium]|nr:SDR family oxidoreductase [Clostridia bacterium]
MKKIAIVTGATSGYGLATAKKLQADGFTVLIVSRNAEKVENTVKEFGFDAGFTLDVTDYAGWLELKKFALEKYGRVDALVNNAGGGVAIKDTVDQTAENIDKTIALNLNSVIYGSKVFGEVMKTQKSGTIVNISSLSAYTSSVSRGEYCISKAGVSMITKLFADRLAEYNITVNEVRPGIIHTGMTEKVQSKYDALIEDGLLPIKRWGEPEDVAKAVAAFCCGEFPYTTGQSFDVDGGFHIRRL